MCASADAACGGIQASRSPRSPRALWGLGPRPPSSRYCPAAGISTCVTDVLLRPLPNANPGQLVRIVHNRPDKAHATLIKFTYLTALEQRHPAFDYVAGFDSYSNLGATQLEATATTPSGE